MNHQQTQDKSDVTAHSCHSGRNYVRSHWILQLRPALLLSLFIMLLAACATTPPPPPSVEKPPELNPQASFNRGDFAEAARQWQEQALSASPGQADTLRISAANAWLLADDPGRAETLLRWINKEELDPSERARLELVQADLALRAGNYEDAAVLLRSAQADLPASSIGRFENLQSQVAQALEVSSRVDLAQIQKQADRMSEYDPVASVTLLKDMESIPSSELSLLANRPRPDPDLDPWLDLALLIRQNLVEADGLEAAAESWKERHPDHYLAAEDVLDMWLNYRQQFQGPGKVAILLPASGRLKAAAEAMRDGMVSAFLDAPNQSEIMFISTGEEPASVPAAYFEARDLGAEFIIGPLQAEYIEALLKLSDLRTPVLALNDLPPGYQAPLGLTGQIHGISLSQDAEIRSTIRAMIDTGFSRAMVLAPESEWGERLVTIFTEEFLQDDRQIVVSGRFQEQENDHSAVLERLLQLDQSKARKAQLENTLQMRVEFEPVRRDDIDVIFMVANSTQGRLLRPQLRFHNAGDLPVYASSRIYSGQPDRTRDQDLNGVRFASLPLQIELAQSRTDSLPASLKGGTFTPLFALGRDAWSILPWLDLMKADPDFAFPGASGRYSAGNGTSLVREPQMAVFKGGVPVKLVLDNEQDQASSAE
jgi:outer membrane PBP1 activator LpoA protein